MSRAETVAHERAELQATAGKRIASSYCLEYDCMWRADGGLAITGGEAQRHADETGHTVHVVAEIRGKKG